MTVDPTIGKETLADSSGQAFVVPKWHSDTFSEPTLEWRKVYGHVVPDGIDPEHERRRADAVERAAEYIVELQAFIDENGGTHE
ncbi:MAG: hypothetical protein WAS36_03735 [Candidatus Saccharimonadales bacterium]